MDTGSRILLVIKIRLKITQNSSKSFKKENWLIKYEEIRVSDVRVTYFIKFKSAIRRSSLHYSFLAQKLRYLNYVVPILLKQNYFSVQP